MEHLRWYDNDENLKLLFKVLQKLPLEAQNTIGCEIVQVMLQKKINTDDLLAKLEYVPQRNRWYDKSESLHSSIKMLKTLSVEERAEILSEVFSTIVSFIHQNKDDL
ncbi:MAG: hypothetical protein PHE78_04560 [Candidatus Gastranaerophilales bacterium]|nr:hypothetical protein [Candidatus Gastranaerophilales bacterium]